jgi:hypothetical protein
MFFNSPFIQTKIALFVKFSRARFEHFPARLCVSSRRRLNSTPVLFVDLVENRC